VLGTVASGDGAQPRLEPSGEHRGRWVRHEGNGTAS
jgi:hypothetical protein